MGGSRSLTAKMGAIHTAKKSSDIAFNDQGESKGWLFPLKVEETGMDGLIYRRNQLETDPARM